VIPAPSSNCSPAMAR